MRWINSLSLLIIILIVLSATAIAESEVIIKPVKNQIMPNEQANYGVTITNNAAEKQRYSIYSFVQGWNVDPSPLRDKIIELRPGKSHSTNILAQPLEDFPPGIYYVSVTIESDLGERYTKPLKVYLSPEEPIDYLPTIKVTVDMDEKITPKEAVPIKLFLENRNPLDLTGMQVKIQSDIPEFVKEGNVDLLPLEKKTVEFTIIPNEFQQPKEYTLFFVFERGGQTIKVVEKNIEIVTLVPSFVTGVEEETVFLKKFTALTVTNPGNVLNTQEVTLPVSFWNSLFTSESDVKIDQNGQRVIFWEISLAPNESKTFNFTTNYRILFYILIVALIFICFYLYTRSPVSVSKTATTTGSGSEGTLSEIKITLEVKNKSRRPLKEITITDYVPEIANVEKSLRLGTLQPKSIQHTKKGTKVVWSLAEIDSNEHRLITYKVRAKLNILGTFSLPRAILGYSKGKGKKRKSYSNIFRLSA